MCGELMPKTFIAKSIENINQNKVAVIKDKDIMKQRDMTIYAQISNKKKHKLIFESSGTSGKKSRHFVT